MGTSGQVTLTGRLMDQIKILPKNEAIPPNPAIRYGSVLKHSPLGAYMIQDDTFLYVNSKICEMFGYSQDEIPNHILMKDYFLSENWPETQEKIS